MTRDTDLLSSSRHWRNIPQQVKPRAMSREGRWRLALRLLRGAGGVAALGVAAWGARQAVVVWHGDPAALAAGSGVVPLQHLALTTDGVLDRAWLARTLALPAGATLAQLNLAQLRGRVLASGQAQEATLTRDYPATLAVRVAEHTPVARLRAAGAASAPARTLLVARDGVVYEGVGYDPALLASLPWLDGTRLARRDGGFVPISGMGPVAKLLTDAQSDAPLLYRTWRVISLARLLSDGAIEVRAQDGLRIIFGTQDDFFPQLARLTLLLDNLRAQGVGPIAQIDLSLQGQDPSRPAGIPVTLAAPGLATPSVPAFPNFHPITLEF
jgi:cell division septal protein FtsQ